MGNVTTEQIRAALTATVVDQLGMAPVERLKPISMKQLEKDTDRRSVAHFLVGQQSFAVVLFYRDEQEYRAVVQCSQR